MLSLLPEGIRLHLPFYDAEHLKFHKNYLQRIDIRKLLGQPTINLQQYADEIVTKSIKKNPNLEIPAQWYPEIKRQRITPVTIGNLAFMMINHQNNQVKIKCESLLNDIKQIYFLT